MRNSSYTFKPLFIFIYLFIFVKFEDVFFSKRSGDVHMD